MLTSAAHYGASHYTRISNERHPWNDGSYPEWTTEIWQQIYAPQADEWVCGADPTVELSWMMIFIAPVPENVFSTSATIGGLGKIMSGLFGKIN